MAVSSMASAASAPSQRGRAQKRSPYPGWFYLPAAIIYAALFLAPTFASLYFSLTRWTLFDSVFIGFENFAQFFREPFLIKGLINTVLYAVISSGLKVVLGMALAIMLTSQITARGYLRSVIFFPVLVSTVGVGITFTVLMHPTQGIINETLAMFSIGRPGWLVDPNLALISVALVDVWKGVGLATVIYIAGVVAIPKDYYEAARIDGATKWQNFLYVTLPLMRPATATVITLSFIGGLRTFDLIWAMTKGGPGFASDTIASVIYKQYQAGFYGLSTAGNVVLFVLIAVLVVPLTMFLNRKQGHE